MPIRQATYGDLLPAAQVAAAAFFEEDLFGPVMHPYRHQYPADVSLWFLRQLRKDFFHARAVLLVSHPASSPNTITGLSVWIRKGPGGEPLDARQSWVAWAAEKMVPVLNRIESIFWPNRAASPDKEDILDVSFPFTKHYWETADRIDSWYLSLCGTGPTFQGQGYGKELVAYGVERAKDEGICASLMSARDKEGFYQRCGFGEPVGWASEGGEANPLHNVPGGAILFTEVYKKA
ncbi:hypothetical protein MBLNU459_g3545t1 [Dothideomycetes sp. NU459]